MLNMARRDFLVAGLATPALLESGHARAETAESAPSPKRFDELAGFEVADVAARYALAIVPAGSLEYHGPHNPLGADSIIIAGIADRVAARTGALLFPTIRFTNCPAHTAHFQGTLSIRPEVMTLYFEDILRSILRLGFRKIFVLNGHDGNIGPARGAISSVTHEFPDAALMLASWWEFVSGEEMKQLGIFHQSNGGHGHGGPLETSVVAAFRPDLVHLDKAHDLPEPPDFAEGRPYYLERDSAEGWPGYSGRVSEASAERGRKVVELSENRLVKLIENWLHSPNEPGSW
jgi:creatinine amidohydrolase